MATINVDDLMNFHAIDISLYLRLVRRLGTTPDSAKRTLAFWLWLEHVGLARDNLTRHISSRPDPVVARFIAEAESCINIITRDDNDEEEEMGSVPFTASVAANERFGLRFLAVHRDVARKGVARVLDGVCGVIFDEEDRRSLFVTFSKGNPLSREEITIFFNERWGDCVERVMMERTSPGVAPMYGRIVFKNAAFIVMILNGESLVKFSINGRQMWARMYVPRSPFLSD
ncbi:hypothetical protein QJS04_geneDACA012475 [Acorus gramineus]|uniref:Uncharacterized protein n=1 Tax=Acorus gramineus TaxID=55184 RepID=A0AAV9B953_ACOGR|nr:hypothetical protein QJS04_geneDACA012475 [Acorus gramineus]